MRLIGFAATPARRKHIHRNVKMPFGGTAGTPPEDRQGLRPVQPWSEHGSGSAGIPQHPIPLPEGSTDTRSRRAAAEFSGRVHRLVGASCASFASVLARKLIRCAAPPLQITTASLGCDLRMTKGIYSLCGFVLTPQFHYGDRNKGSRQIPYSIKGSVAHKPVDQAENSRKRVLLPMGEVCLNTKIMTKRRSNIHEKPRHL